MKINFIHILFITTTLAMGPIANAASQPCVGTQTEKDMEFFAGCIPGDGQGGTIDDLHKAEDVKTGLDIAQDLADL